MGDGTWKFIEDGRVRMTFECGRCKKPSVKKLSPDCVTNTLLPPRCENCGAEMDYCYTEVEL